MSHVARRDADPGQRNRGGLGVYCADAIIAVIGDVYVSGTVNRDSLFIVEASREGSAPVTAESAGAVAHDGIDVSAYFKLPNAPVVVIGKRYARATLFCSRARRRNWRLPAQHSGGQRQFHLPGGRRWDEHLRRNTRRTRCSFTLPWRRPLESACRWRRAGPLAAGPPVRDPSTRRRRVPSSRPRSSTEDLRESGPCRQNAASGPA